MNILAGVLVADTDVTATSGPVKEGTSQTVSFSFDITADATGGSVSGSNLWQLTSFGSVTPSGYGARVNAQVLSLGGLQGSTGVTAGSTSTISGLGVTWNLTDGAPSCADFGYFCVELDKNPSSSIDFELSGHPSDSVLTSCQPIVCRGNDHLGL